MSYQPRSWHIPILGTIADEQTLASILNIPQEILAVAIREAPRMYVRVPLKKKDGTPRPIHAPNEDLKLIQRSILDTILVQVALPLCAYGFSAGKGIIENAQLHSKHGYVLTLDIKDFFPSVHHTRVRRVFESLGATPFAADNLTALTVLEHSLPQGAPSSPYLAALALKDVDVRIRGLCYANGLSYSRYFDDITISGNIRAHEVLDTVKIIVESSGYKVHDRADKLRLYKPGEVRLITGITVEDGKLGVPNVGDLIEYIEELKQYGLVRLRRGDPFKERLSLQGKIVFLSQVDESVGQALHSEFKQIMW